MPPAKLIFYFPSTIFIYQTNNVYVFFAVLREVNQKANELIEQLLNLENFQQLVFAQIEKREHPPNIREFQQLGRGLLNEFTMVSVYEKIFLRIKKIRKKSGSFFRNLIDLACENEQKKPFCSVKRSFIFLLNFLYCHFWFFESHRFSL